MRIQFARTDDIVIHDKPVLALASDDVDADCARWQAAGARVVSPPQAAPWAEGVRWATLRDSEENLLFVGSRVDRSFPGG